MVTLDEIKPVLARIQRPAGSILLATIVVGSHAHGTHIPTTDPRGIDDTDLVNIFLPPSPMLLGIDSWEHMQQWDGQYDVIAYSLKKVIGLLSKSNPNVLMLLDMPKDCVLYSHWVWELLVYNKSMFLTKEAFHSFAGYASGQLKKMEGSTYNGYMGEKRKALVDAKGYDTKNAAHLIRLLRMCFDLFDKGSLVIRRPDAETLIDIKRGNWEIEEVKHEAETLFRKAREAMESSSLPDRIHRGRVGELSARLHLEGWNGERIV